MSFSLIFRIALRALMQNRTRSLLTMLGVIIGVAAVISMLSIGNGASRAMQAQIEKMGTNTIEVSPGFRRGRNRGSSGASRRLLLNDWALLTKIPGVVLSSPTLEVFNTVVYGRASWNARITAVGADYLHIVNWPLAEGRSFSQAEVDRGDNVIILGSKLRQELFGSLDPLGETVRIGTVPLVVIGVLAERGNEGWRRDDEGAIVSYSTYMRKIRKTDQLSTVILQASTAESVDSIVLIAKALLNNRYKVTNPDDGGFEADSSQEASEAAEASAKIFSYLLGGVASISLLVGGIGIMNIMLVSVTERIREIGIRMACGARGRDILAQFLVEAIVLSLIGGALGVILGILISLGIAQKAGWPAVVSQGSILLGFGTAALTGIFFGFYPALAASRLDPIEALRSD